MSNTLARRTRHLLEWALLAAWAGSVLLVDLFWVDLRVMLWLAAFTLTAALWVGMVGLVGFIVVRAFLDREWIARTLLLAVLAGVGILHASAGERVSLMIRFNRMKPNYEAIIADLQAGKATKPPVERFIVEPGPSLRVAFPWPGGIIDNWSGVVYDPTGLVMKASLFKRDFSNSGDPELRQVKSLFGGDLYGCEHLEGPWYFCYFT